MRGFRVHSSECIKVQRFSSAKIEAHSIKQPPAVGRLTTLTRAARIYFLTTAEELKGDSRSQCAYLPRWVIYYIAVRRLGYSTSAVGRFLNKDHTTVLHGGKVMAKLIEQDGGWRTHVLSVLELATILDPRFIHGDEIALLEGGNRGSPKEGSVAGKDAHLDWDTMVHSASGGAAARRNGELGSSEAALPAA